MDNELSIARKYIKYIKYSSKIENLVHKILYTKYLFIKNSSIDRVYYW